MLKRYILLIFLGVFSCSWGEQTIIYNKTTGDRNLKTVWTLERKNNTFFIESQNADQTTTIEASIPYSVETYQVVSHKNSNKYTFSKTGTTLKAEGKKRGKNLKEAYNISGKNWVQEFELGLGSFLRSSDTEYKFVILNPKNFKLYDMVASKVGEETITLDDNEVKALKVKITLQGFKSMFWKGFAWYDIEKHTMLVYKANDGPHTPTTTISLVSKEGSPHAWYHTLWDKLTKDQEETSSH